MRLLLDHCVPQGLGKHLEGHDVTTAATMQWDRLRNGKLLTAAAEAGFDAVVTVDQNLKYQQNPLTLPVAVVVIRSVRNDVGTLAGWMPLVLAALASLQPRTLVEIPRE